MKKLLLATTILSAFSITTSFSQTIEWVNFWGGSNGTGAEQPKSITTDASGNVYTIGQFGGYGVDFDPGPGTFLMDEVNGTLFISKSDASGQFEWAKQMHSIENSGVTLNSFISADASGNVYIAGEFKGTIDFDPGTGVNNLTSATTAQPDIFITKWDAAGNFLWAKQIGSVLAKTLTSISSDATGNICITGTFAGTVDFDPSSSVQNLTAVHATYTSIFIAKMDATGNLLWVKRTGSNVYNNDSYAITFDNSGNIYASGKFAGSVSGYVYKLNGSGDSLWKQTFGGDSRSITVDPAGNVYARGTFMNTADFDPGTGVSNLTSTQGFYPDVYVCKLNANGGFSWARLLSGVNWFSGYNNSVTCDTNGNVYYTGSFNGTFDADPGTGTLQLVAAGSVDAFITSLDSAGNFLWAKHISGTADEEGRSIITDNSNNIYSIGWFGGTADFDAGSGNSLTASGAEDIYVIKLGQLGVNLNDPDKEKYIRVFPIPAENEVIIDGISTGYKISITDVNGTTVTVKTFESQDGIIVNTSGLVNGIYLLKILQDKGVLIRKLIIQR